MKLFSFFQKDKPSYKCSCCGQVYVALPLCFGSDFPECYYSIPPSERESRIIIKESLFILDEQHFFHRGRLVIPITDHNENLIFNVWTSISAENFDKRMNFWEDPARTKQEPYFGWLQTSIPTYGDTINIKSIAIEQAVGLIPEIKLIEENHPLTIDQENGISYKRAVEIVDGIIKLQHNSN